VARRAALVEARRPQPFPSRAAGDLKAFRAARARYAGARQFGANTALTAHLDAVIAALEADHAEFDAEWAAAGIPDLDALSGRLCEEINAVEERIMAAPAKTVAGFAVKASVVTRNFTLPEEADYGDVAAQALATALRDAAGR
jgi:hypothetical protein